MLRSPWAEHVGNKEVKKNRNYKATYTYNQKERAGISETYEETEPAKSYTHRT